MLFRSNDKGRLSKDDIERMVKEAEKFKDEDKKEGEKIDSKNNLESYVYQVKSSIEDDKLKEKIGEDNLKNIRESVDDIIKWFDDDNYEKEDYDNKMKELQNLFNPLMSKMYSQDDKVEKESENVADIQDVD